MKPCQQLKAAMECTDILSQMCRFCATMDDWYRTAAEAALAGFNDAEDINPDACPWRNGITPDLIDLTRAISLKARDLYDFIAILEGEARDGGVTRTSDEVIALFRSFTPWLMGSKGGNEPYAIDDGGRTDMPEYIHAQGDIDQILTHSLRVAFAVRQWEVAEAGEKDAMRVMACSYLTDIREACDQIEASMPVMAETQEKAP